MDGMAEWKVQIESNAKEVAEKVLELQRALNELEQSKTNIEITIDKKKFDSVISQINNMLQTIGKKTNSVKTFTSMLREINKVNKSIKELMTSFDSIDNSSVNKFKKLLSPINDLSSSIKTLNGTIKDFKKTFESFGSRAVTEIGKVEKAAKKLEKATKQSAESAKRATASSEKQVKSQLESYEKRIATLKNKHKGYAAKPIPENQNDNYKNQLSELNSAIDALETEYKRIISLGSSSSLTKEQLKFLDELYKKALNAADAFKLLSASQKGSSPISRAKLLNQISEYYKLNSAMGKEARREIQLLMKELSSRGANANVEDLAARFNLLKTSIREAGQEGRSFRDLIKDKAFHGLASAIGTYFGFEDFINMLQKGIGVVRELDSALTEMRKVSDESLSSLKAYQNISFDIADDVGATAKTIQNSTADWMRIGESLSKASDSAKASNILLNVSEFETIDEATASLVSMSQAYKDLDKMEIIDVANKLGNAYAISTDGIATALKDSASALSTAQNDFYEAAALITAGNTIAQNPSKVGAGLRTISLRLTGTEAAKKELMDLGEDVSDFQVTTVSKLNSKIKELTKTIGKEGVSLLDLNGNYRSTYEILLDIADVWEEIAKEDLVTGQNRQNALLEMIAGKNRSNIAASILENPEILRSAYEDAKYNSKGSSEEELQKHLESIDGKIQQLQNRAQEFWHTFISSDVVKAGIDGLTIVLELLTAIVDKAGSIPTILGGITGGLSLFKNVGRDKMYSLFLNMPTAC